MEVAALEVLLLDTTEKEGEDNKLLHTCENGCLSVSRWSEMRGVFAAAMGTMKSVAGEPLTVAHFDPVDAGDEETAPTLVGFVDLNEVLFVMVFVECTLPERIVEYYAQSSCELLVSLLGYPDKKLRAWQSDERNQGILDKVTRICRGIFACIRRDICFETHLHFAFDGCVPAVTYPLDIMARLSAFHVVEPQAKSYELVGCALFYRKALVFAKTTPPILKILNQWLLNDEFDGEAMSGDGASLMLFTWFDAHYALCGPFPPVHSLVRIRCGDLHIFYILRHKELNDFEPFKLKPSALISTEDLAELLNFANTKLQLHYGNYLQARRNDVHFNKSIWFAIVQDKIRHTMHGCKPLELFDPTVNPSAAASEPAVWKSMLEMLVVETSDSFQRRSDLRENVEPTGCNESAALNNLWAPRAKLDFEKQENLLVRPVPPEDDEGADLSSEDPQIFPPIQHQLDQEAAAAQNHPGGELRQEASRFCLPDGKFVWVVGNYYDAFDLFGVCDADVPIERLEQEMESLLRVEEESSA